MRYISKQDIDNAKCYGLIPRDQLTMRLRKFCNKVHAQIINKEYQVAIDFVRRWEKMDIYVSAYYITLAPGS